MELHIFCTKESLAKNALSVSDLKEVGIPGEKKKAPAGHTIEYTKKLGDY